MRYEYLITTELHKLNEFGLQGWEAVGIMTDPQFDQYDPNVLRYNVHSVLLKRALPDGT